jgi:tRNA 2-thiouridine synthesizing protein A
LATARGHILLLCVFLGVGVRNPGHYGHCERDRMSRTWLGRREKGSGRGGDSGRSAGSASSPDSPDSLVSPVTEAARAAAAGAWVPGEVPPGATPLLTIDALGRKCPIPIIMLAAQIRDVPVGGVIAVLADDPAVYTDVPAWCALKSHECVFRADLPSGWAFGIRRGY